MVLNFNKSDKHTQNYGMSTDLDLFSTRGVMYVHPELVFLTDISYVLHLFKGTLNWDP